jgi:micrococcal nuclease
MHRRALFIGLGVLAVVLAACSTPSSSPVDTGGVASQASPLTSPSQTPPPSASPGTASATPKATTTKPKPTSAKPKPTSAKPKPTAAPGLDPRYSTCKEAKSHGYGPYYRGTDPEYAWYTDRDKDGIVCE